MNAVVTALNAYFIVTFGAVGLEKMRMRASFMFTLLLQGIIPNRLAPFLGRALGPYEVMVAIWLATGWQSRASATVLCTTLAGFLAYRATLFRRKMFSDCGCTAGSKKAVGSPELVVSGLFLAGGVAFLALISEGHHPSQWSIFCLSPLAAAMVVRATGLLSRRFLPA